MKSNLLKIDDDWVNQAPKPVEAMEVEVESVLVFEPEKIYKCPEIIKILKTSSATLSKLLRSKKLRGFKVGKDWRVLGEHLNQYLNRK